MNTEKPRRTALKIHACQPWLALQYLRKLDEQKIRAARRMARFASGIRSKQSKARTHKDRVKLDWSYRISSVVRQVRVPGE